MTRFLIKSGHRDIGFIIGDPDHVSAPLRHKGFKAEMSAHGLALNPNWIVQGDKRPTAIFASNDDMAAGVIAIAGHMGISVPDDLSIGGFDDTATAKIVWPRLSTIRQPVRDMGARAAEFLIGPDGGAFGEGDSKHLSYEHHLIIRESTKAI